jgi:hypothetical protein
MAQKSFTVIIDRVDPEPGFDGLAALMNVTTSASGTQVAVTDVRAYFPSGFNSDQTNLLGTQGNLSLDRITASSGGSAISALKFDTNAASLPAEVQFRLFPLSVTEDGRLRLFGDAFSMGILQSISLQGQYRAPGILDANDHSGRTSEGQDVWHADGQGDTQPIVLREGEGIAVLKRAYGVCQAHHWQVVVKVVSTGNTYRFPVTDAGSPYCLDDPVWSLMNGTGSGIVLNVFIVSMPDLGESNIPRFRLCRISGINESGTEIAPVAHDTNNTLTEIKAYRGEFRAAPDVDGLTINYLNYQSTPVTIAEQQNIGTFRRFMVGTIHTVTAPPNYRCFMQDEIWPGERRMGSAGGLSLDAIWLDPGEGLAVMGGIQGTIETSEGAFINVEITGYIVTPDTPTGSNTYSRGRVVNA